MEQIFIKWAHFPIYAKSYPSIQSIAMDDAGVEGKEMGEKNLIYNPKKRRKILAFQQKLINSLPEFRRK